MMKNLVSIACYVVLVAAFTLGADSGFSASPVSAQTSNQPLRVYIADPSGQAHHWNAELPQSIRAYTRNSADLVVAIRETQRNGSDWATYRDCGVIYAKQTIYHVTLFDTENRVIASETFYGPMGDLPYIIINCTVYSGGPPSWTTFLSWLERHIDAAPGQLEATATPPDPTERVVRSERTWQSTGLRVSSGDRLSIDYVDGTWTWSAGHPGFDASGDPDPANTCAEICNRVAPGDSPAGRFCPIPDAPIGELVARLGGGSPFSVGNHIIRVAGQASGGGRGQLLYLAMNDCSTGLYDNTGSLQVRIQVRR
ncbi:MAG: hypothetical protein JNL42_16725 [Anaerolineae bacterium]|nr:hypothetical protein [Anaerolineae bacterium]